MSNSNQLSGTSAWFQVKGGVRQGCILYVEKATTEALDGYDKGFQIGGRTINNIRYMQMK